MIQRERKLNHFAIQEIDVVQYDDTPWNAVNELSRYVSMRMINCCFGFDIMVFRTVCLKIIYFI